MHFRHSLLKHALTYPRPKQVDLSPPECTYDFALGLWVVDSTGQWLTDTPDRRNPRTKKQDVETGEDQKGT
jgi:hypothetical protein